MVFDFHTYVNIYILQVNTANSMFREHPNLQNEQFGGKNSGSPKKCRSELTNITYIPLIVLAFWGVICYRSHPLKSIDNIQDLKKYANILRLLRLVRVVGKPDFGWILVGSWGRGEVALIIRNATRFLGKDIEKSRTCSKCMVILKNLVCNKTRAVFGLVVSIPHKTLDSPTQGLGFRV